MLRHLPGMDSLAGVRRQLVEDFSAKMAAAGMERFAAAGLAATWWEDSVHELQTAVSRGWKAVIEAWLTTADASQDDKNAPDLADQIAIGLLAGPQLTSRAELASALASLNAGIKFAEASGEGEEESREATPTSAEVKKMKAERTKRKKSLRAIDTSLLATARQTLAVMSDIDAPDEVIGVLRNRVERLVADHITDIERSTIDWYDGLVSKYGNALGDLETQRDAAVSRLEKYLKELGYA